MNEINDIRLPKEFNGISFSNFKKADVRKELLNSLNNNKIENACNWSAELICAGHFSDLWEIIIYNIGKNIHLANPKIPIYVDMRFQNFKEIVQNGYIGNEIAMRNNEKIRTIFCELVTVLCLSNKKPAFECVKIINDEFNLLNMTNKFKAPDTSYALKVFDKGDPKEIFIPINELVYHLSRPNSNLLECCYWIEWIVEFDNICRKKKENLTATCRTFASVDDKYRNNVIWIIWDILLYYVDLLNNEYISQLMNSLLKIFCIKYTSASCKKRRYLLYFAISLLTENIPTNIELISDKNIIKIVVSKINIIYKQIKKNEESPNTEYLFANLEKENTFEQSMRKMNMVNSMDFMTR